MNTKTITFKTVEGVEVEVSVREVLNGLALLSLSVMRREDVDKIFESYDALKSIFENKDENH